MYILPVVSYPACRVLPAIVQSKHVEACTWLQATEHACVLLAQAHCMREMLIKKREALTVKLHCQACIKFEESHKVWVMSDEGTAMLQLSMHFK